VIIIFSETSGPALGSNQPLFNGYLVSLPRREVNLSPSFSVDVKNVCIPTSNPHIFIHGVDKGTFNFTVPLNY